MHFIKANSTKVFDNTQHCHLMNIEAAMLKVAMAHGGNKSAGLKDNFQQGDSYEQYQYFYHPDHLGSSSFITNTEGEVVQHVEYVPYGEVFIEERNNVWNTPYLFNAKEFDEETGLYYYGARYYDSRLAMWYGVDALAEKYPNMGGYVYCAGNPVKLVEPDGNRPTPAEAARMAAHVYGDKKDDILTGGWRVSERYISGVEYNTSHGLKSALYERVGENGEVLEYSYVTCGSETGRDWIENALQLEGMSSEYKESAQNAKIISENIGKDTELTFIGHSQGGGEAALNSLITSNDEVVGRSAITFNAAGLSAKTKFNIGGLATLLKSGKEIDTYVMLTCPLNLYQNSIGNSLPHMDGNIHLLCPQDISYVVNGHSIDNVLKNFGVNNPDN